MAQSFFVEISFLIIAATLIIALTRLLKQPLIIGYLITGIIASPSILNLVKSVEMLATFSEIGVALLLFMVGLNLNPRIIKDVGKISLIIGVGQVLFTSIIGFLILKALGFSSLTSLYVAIALTFSSTIIIMKLLSDKGDLEKLYGKISIGFLIVQDIIAIFILMIISSLSQGNNIAEIAARTTLIGALLLGVIFMFSYLALPRITKLIAKSQEFLLLFSLGWCFAIATLFDLMNFSIEIGALVAGITLSLSPYGYEISSKLKPLRDFFIFMFFIWLGSQVFLPSVSTSIPTIILLSLFILIGNPFIVVTLMGIMKYKKKTSFLAGLTVAQISEFSLILIALGVKLGHLTPETLSLVTLVGIITIAGSTYFIIYSDKLYYIASPLLSLFERRITRNESSLGEKNYDIILFGAHRMGSKVIDALYKKKNSLLIVDFNPEIIEKLSRKGYNVLYGDISDSSMLEDMAMSKAKIVISTIPEVEANIIIKQRLIKTKSKAVFIATSEYARGALELYKNGIDLALVPHLISGEYLAALLESNKVSTKKYKDLGKTQLKELVKKLKMK